MALVSITTFRGGQGSRAHVEGDADGIDARPGRSVSRPAGRSNPPGRAAGRFSAAVPTLPQETDVPVTAAWLTLSDAAVVVAEPAELVKTAWNRSPL